MITLRPYALFFLALIPVAGFAQEATASSFVKVMRSITNSAAGTTTTWKLLNTSAEKAITVIYGWSDDKSAAGETVELTASGTVVVADNGKHKDDAKPEVRTATFSSN